jgi:protein gp37
MGENSKIEWTDHTFNPWIGCTKVHAGCTHCYAESLAKRTGSAQWGPSGTRVMTSEKYWEQPRKWQREAVKTGVRRRVFCASLADVFEDWQGQILDHRGAQIFRSAEGLLTSSTFDRPRDLATDEVLKPATLDDVRRYLFAVIDDTPMLDWLLLTKRPENIRRMTPHVMWSACDSGDCPHDRASDCDTDDQRKFRSNVWLGTSISDQATADQYVPELLKARDLAPVLFLSAEPLLGPVDFSAFFGGEYATPMGAEPNYNFGVDWVIVGGESGHGARPMHPDWARSLRDQCQAAGVAFHFKQWGEWLPFTQIATTEQRERFAHEQRAGGSQTYFGARIVNGPQGPMTGTTPGVDPACIARIGKAAAGRLLDGRTWEEFPEVAHA